VAQGISGALIAPQVLATFHATLDGPRHGKAIGYYGATIGLAAAVGQILGGILVTADIAGATWRPVFLVNVPIGLIVIIAARYLIPETRSPRPASVDLLGTGLFGLTIISLLVPLAEGQSLGWPLWTWLVLAVAPLAAVATYRAERSSERRGGSPLLPPSLLGLPSMRRGLGLGLPFFLGMGGFWFVIVLTVQTGLHHDALEAGLVFAPLGVVFVAGSVLTPRLIARYGRSVMTAGGVLAALGLASLVVIVTTTWPHVNLFAFVPGMAAVGLGNALIAVSLNRLLLADVPPERAGIGGGVVVTLQQTGFALGVATLGTLFISTEPHHIAGGFGWAVGISAAVAAFVAIGSFALPRLPVSPGPAPTATAVE
jgi:MFS family permease